ncbi:hypothetical protein BV898_07416 [Hypsibius exemplaris]|uniref:Uncharacterized protein n=1 Tax=Hypsibius exemplaris TaxID=2072580 RepID=A0A1W0WTS0_HYPEX|nr:hypothetical protein BV898_07416 [Hypsibius exemplaris]
MVDRPSESVPADVPQISLSLALRRKRRGPSPWQRWASRIWSERPILSPLGTPPAVSPQSRYRPNSSERRHAEVELRGSLRRGTSAIVGGRSGIPIPGSIQLPQDQTSSSRSRCRVPLSPK